MLLAMRHGIFRIAVVTVFLSLTLACTYAQNIAPALSAEALGKGAVPLNGPWQFHLGDNLAWADPAANDATGQNGWEQLAADKPWGAQGHPSQTGYGWYRKHLHLSPAPGAGPNFALLIPGIGDIYEVYWNGGLVGRYGKLPPHPQRFNYLSQPQQIWGLGPARDGVLAIRVWKAPLDSFSPAEIGGFEATPLIGSPEAIAAAKTQDDYTWVRGSQFSFLLWFLYDAVAVLGFLLWLRNRGQRELLALAVYCGATVGIYETLSTRLPVPYSLGLSLAQLLAGLEDVGLWYLLLYLFRLDSLPRVARFTRNLAIVQMATAVPDAMLALCDWSSPFFSPWVQTVDGILTAANSIARIYTLVLVGFGVFSPERRKLLDASRWFLVATATLNGGLMSALATVDQGRRFTHWHASEKLTAPLFTINGNHVMPATLTSLLLFAAIVCGVFQAVRTAAGRQAAIERELQSARELQQALIPETLPQLPGYALAGAYIPAQEVGGDFFQVIPLEGEHAGSTLIVLGDVSGKGLKAAMAVSVIVGAVRSLADFTSSPAEILAGLNRRLHGRLQGGFATCIVLRVDRDRSFVVANAGHLAPLVNGREIDLLGALPLGLVPSASYEEREFELQPGERLTLVTDGVVEAQSASGELFGFERTALASAGDAEAIAQAAKQFGQVDDITVLTLASA
jgi:hypothetical protein